jgi:D-glycero-D-manno-heptose 1,7-bisphosphate phosphatase
MEVAPRKRFVILDRDGTINVEREYLSDPAGLELTPNAAVGLALMRQMGFGLLVVTNQSGVARGFLTEQTLARIHRQLDALLEPFGAALDGYYHCPHLPENGCRCRKPKTDLVDRAAAEWGFQASQAIVIGDKPCDIELGRALGAQTMLVRTGYGRQIEAAGAAMPDFIVDDLLHAARQIQVTLGQAAAAA